MKEPKLNKLDEDADTVTYSIDESEELDTDPHGTALVALSDLTNMSDDLYAMIGEGHAVTQDEIDSILSAYDLISEIHDRYDDDYTMPSRDYDNDDWNVEVMEDVEELDEDFYDKLEKLDQVIAELLKKHKGRTITPEESTKLGKSIQQKKIICRTLGIKYYTEGVEELDEAASSFKDVVKKHGFSKADDFKLKRPYKLKSVYGLKMRADKWADTFIGEIGDSAYRYFIRTNNNEDYYWTDLDFVTAFNYMVKEEVELDETPYTPTKLEKIRTSIKHFEKKLKDARPEVKDDLEKIIAKLKKEEKQYMVKKEEVEELDEAKKFKLDSAKHDVDYSHVKDDDFIIHVNDKKTGKTVHTTQMTLPGHDPKTKDKWAQASIVMAAKRALAEDTKYIFTQGSNITLGDNVVLHSILENLSLPEDGIMKFDSIDECKQAVNDIIQYYNIVREENVTHVDLDALAEEFDETKFRRLALTGLVSDTDVAKIIRAMKNLSAGKTLDPSQKTLIADTFLNLIGVITGDSSIFGKVSKAVKTEETEDPCWDDHEMIGMKSKNGKKVPNCVPKKS